MDALRVLLVEDEPSYARLVRELMAEARGARHVIDVAASLVDGMRAAREVTPDVILLDLGLPDAEGLEAVEEMRAAAPRTPIVVLSGQDDVDTALESMRRGAQEYLVKGQAEHVLLPRAIRYAMERKRAQDLEQLLVGIVGHDLRNPLNTITMAQQLLGRSPNITAEERRNLDRIVGAATRATRLVRDLLDVTRLRLNGSLPVQTQRCDVAALVRQVVDEFRMTHPQRRVEMSGGPALATVDPERLQQAIANLLGNALQHGQRDAPVSVSVEAREDGVEVTIHNYGPPIPEAVLPRLFEPLSRASDAGDETGSIGLGLFIANHIAAAHSGSIRVKSDASDGTRFCLWIPGAPPLPAI